MTERLVGPLLNELCVMADLDENERITDVLVLAKTTNLETGDASLVIATNELDWIAQAGLHAAYHQVLEPPTLRDG